MAAEVEQPAFPDVGGEATADGLAEPRIESAVEDTLAVWKVVEESALALALLVSTAVFNTGALRVALIDFGVVKESRFPPSMVVGQGVFYAALLAVAVVPLVLGWRSLAVGLVDRVLGSPKAGIPSQAWLDTRARLEGRLGLDARILRHPITALSLLSPLLTALLTCLCPEPFGCRQGRSGSATT